MPSKDIETHRNKPLALHAAIHRKMLSEPATSCESVIKILALVATRTRPVGFAEHFHLPFSTGGKPKMSERLIVAHKIEFERSWYVLHVVLLDHLGQRG